MWLNWFRLGSKTKILKTETILRISWTRVINSNLNSWRATLQLAVLLLCFGKKKRDLRVAGIRWSVVPFRQQKVSPQGTGKGPPIGQEGTTGQCLTLDMQLLRSK
jgi:hypothetical protein